MRDAPPDAYANHDGFGACPSGEWNTEWARPAEHLFGRAMDATHVLMCNKHDLPMVETVLHEGRLVRKCAFCVARSVPSPVGAFMGAV
jgi:hypothetical protein